MLPAQRPLVPMNSLWSFPVRNRGQLRRDQGGAAGGTGSASRSRRLGSGRGARAPFAGAPLPAETAEGGGTPGTGLPTGAARFGVAESGSSERLRLPLPRSRLPPPVERHGRSFGAVASSSAPMAASVITANQIRLIRSTDSPTTRPANKAAHRYISSTAERSEWPRLS